MSDNPLKRTYFRLDSCPVGGEDFTPFLGPYRTLEDAAAARDAAASKDSYRDYQVVEITETVRYT